MASDSGTWRTSNTGSSTDTDNTKPKVETSPEKDILLPMEPDTHIKIESERTSNAFPNLESTHHNIEQKKTSETENTRSRTICGGNGKNDPSSDQDSFRQNKASHLDNSRPSVNIRFEKTEGKFRKFINNAIGMFRSDYSGQKKNSRRNLK